MPFRSHNMPIVYPDEAGKPCAMLYRIAFTEREPWLAVVHLHQNEDSYVSPVASASVRDQVLNRILEVDLRGLPIGAVRLVASDRSGAFEYAISPDIHDFIERGNRYRTAPDAGRRGRIVERIEIDPATLIAGRVRVDTVHADPTPPSEAIRAALT